MDATFYGLVVAVCVFAGAMLGMWLQTLLPERHLGKETTEVVRLATGMLSVLSSLVLGLLIATAKSAYDATDQSVRSYAAELILLSETLRDYGDSAQPVRAALARFTALSIEDNWPADASRPMLLDDRQAGLLLEHVREAIRALKPLDVGQTSLQAEALAAATTLMQQRWLLIEHSGRSVRPVVLAILVGWIVLIFVSFGLSAPRNATVVTAMLICSVAIGTAIFLVSEMDTPFRGVLAISPEPMRSALAHMRL